MLSHIHAVCSLAVVVISKIAMETSTEMLKHPAL